MPMGTMLAMRTIWDIDIGYKIQSKEHEKVFCKICENSAEQNQFCGVHVNGADVCEIFLEKFLISFRKSAWRVIIQYTP